MFVLKTVFMCFVVFFEKQQTVFTKMIIDGNAADIKFFPYVGMAQIYCKSIEGRLLTCGATIITENMFLTAAHCTYCPVEGNKPKINVIVGNTNYTAGTHVEITKYEAHPKYSPEKLIFNDIALLYASEGIPMGETVNKVLISKKFLKFKHAVIAGWGRTHKKNEIVPHRLTYLPITFVPRKECAKRGFHDIGVISGTFCAGHLQSHKYVYGGEFGSGLVIKDNGTEYLVGVITAVLEEHLSIAVYTNVSFHYDWINKTIDKLSKQDKDKSKEHEHDRESRNKSIKKHKNIFNIFHEDGYKKLLLNV